MQAVDTNILVYAHRREALEHTVAREVIRKLAEGTTAWAIPWPCIYEFFGVVTNKRIWKEHASHPKQAWAQIEAWLGSPSLQLLSENPQFDKVLKVFATSGRVRGPVIHDARIAALCIANGVDELLTRDRDFALFHSLKVRNPLH